MKPKKTRIFLLLFSLTMCFLLANGSDSSRKLKFEHFTTDDGLSQNSIRTLLQCRKGFLWIGTENGLDRFDGYGFKHYRYNRKDSNTISNNFIYDLHEDSEGLIWIGTNHGLNRLDPSTGNLIHYFSGTGDGSVSHNSVTAIY